MSDQSSGPRPGPTLAFMGLMALCCAGPALVAAGAVGALGGFLANPLVIATGVLLAGLVVGLAVWRNRSRGAHADEDCCPPAFDRPDDRPGR